jgi:hypothetical protein
MSSAPRRSGDPKKASIFPPAKLAMTGLYARARHSSQAATLRLIAGAGMRILADPGSSGAWIYITWEPSPSGDRRCGRVQPSLVSCG